MCPQAPNASKRTLPAAALFVLAFGLSPCIAGTPARDRVTYTSSRPGSWDVYLFGGESGAPRRITDDPGLDYDPVVSPDGRWLVFTSERRGSPDLYALDLKHGGAPRLLIDSDALEDQAAFSPDGRSIAFVSTVGGDADIYLVPFQPRRTVRMSAARNLAHDPGGDFHPAFSPDGTELAFSSDRGSPVEAINPITRFRSGDIYVLNLKSRGLRQLTHDPGWDGSPAWSPDGKSIAFYSERNEANQRAGINGDQPASIWVMNPDGSGQRALTSASTTALSPAFLPNGRILFARRPAIATPGGSRASALRSAQAGLYERGVWQIMSISIDGSDERVESARSDQNYWAAKPGPTPGSFVAYGTAPDVSGTTNGDPETFGGRGAALVEGAPIRKRLPDRAIDIYPLRYFSAILKPNEDVLLYTSPPPNNRLGLSTIDGRNQRPLQHQGAPIVESVFGLAGFQWSRDGQWLTYTGSTDPAGTPGPGGLSQVWIASADGGTVRNLTSDWPGYSGYPAFSADGKRIVFRRGTNPVTDIALYVMNADGTDVKRLTNDSANYLFPKYSPVGHQIAFLSNRDNPKSSTYDVYVMDLGPDDTAGPVRRVTNNDVQEGHLAYSPDGKWLVFSSEMGGLNDEEPLVRSVQFAAQSYGEMYAYRLKDGALVRLTHNKWEEGVPSWEAAVRTIRNR